MDKGNDGLKWIAVAILLSTTIVAFSLRYETFVTREPSLNGEKVIPIIHVLDRWTGKVRGTTGVE